MSEPGTVLSGRYELLSELGRGGMSVVWRARDRELERDVALKLLHPQFAGDPEFLERFRREARAAAGLSHPSVVAVYDVGEDTATGNPFLVMELVEGEDLKARIRREAPLPDRDIREIGGAVAGALAHAHQRGLVHRDVKPQNVLLDRDGRARLTDFGIARALSDAGLTRTGLLLGSVHYLAPELARGHPATPASDVYSLGAVLYEMATGRVPFSGETELAVALAHAEREPRPAGSLNPRLAPDLEETIQRAMAKRPAERFASAGELQATLRGSGPAQTTVVMPAPERPRRLPSVAARPRAPGRAPGRRVREGYVEAPDPRTGPGGGFALALLALTLLLVLGVFFFRAGPPERDQTVAQPAPTATVATAGRQATPEPAAPPPVVAETPPAAARAERAVPPAPAAEKPAAPAQAERAPAARGGQPAVAAPSERPPAQRGGEPPLDPVELMRRHYALIDAGQYDESYKLMSARLQALNSPAEYESWFANKVELEPISITLVSQEGERAVVDTLVRSVDRANGDTVEQQVAERFVLVREGGAWRIDQVTRLSS